MLMGVFVDTYLVINQSIDKLKFDMMMALDDSSSWGERECLNHISSQSIQ